MFVYVVYEDFKNKYFESQNKYDEILREKEYLFSKTQPKAARTDKIIIAGTKTNVFDEYLVVKEKKRIDQRLEEIKANKPVAVDEKDVTIVNKNVLVDRANYAMTAFNTDEDGVAPVLLGYGITGRIDWAANFMVITGKSTRTNADGTVGVQFKGLVDGEEVTLFAATEPAKAATVLGTTVTAGVIGEGSSIGNAGNLAIGDVIIYSVNGAGEAAKIVRIQDAATMDGHIDATVPVGTPPVATPTFNTGAVKVGTVDVAGTTYTYYLGYVSELKGARLTIQDDMAAVATDSMTLTLKPESIVTEVATNHATGVKVLVGDTGSFVADAGIAIGTPDLDGDIALIKAVNDVVVVEAVVYKNK